MYEPKGGNKPAYNPPAEPPQYEKPPTEPPTYQKPPVEEPPKYQPEEPEEPEKPPCEEPTGPCDCTKWDIPGGPGDDEPFRRLLLRLEAVLEELSEKPTDATKKFVDDLKDADKEYQGVVAIVTKYKEFFDKLDCRFAEIRTWREEFENWLSGKITDDERNAIRSSRETNYDALEKKICCDWIKCRDYYISMQDCLEQAKRKEEEAKDDYDAVKGFEKTLTERFTELKGLFDKAKTYRDEERFKALFAVTLEFEFVVENLSLLRDWWYARKECGGGNDNPCGTGYEQTGDPREDWKPEKLRAQLICRLRQLILAKYQRFRWQHDFLSRASDNEKRKEACKKFRADRRDQFIQESEDVSAPSGGGGGGGGGGGQQPGQYQGGQQPTPQPGYQPTPQPGGYQPPPPTGGYEQKQPPGQEPKPPAEGYQPQPPTGGYEPKPPTGGYQDKGKKS